MTGWLLVAVYEGLALRFGWQTMTRFFKLAKRTLGPKVCCALWIALTAHLLGEEW